MPIVRMPDGTNVRFPDDMPKEQIKSIISTKFPEVTGGDNMAGQEQDAMVPNSQGYSGIADKASKGLKYLSNLSPSNFAANMIIGDGDLNEMAGRLSSLSKGYTMGLGDKAMGAINAGVNAVGGLGEGLGENVAQLATGQDLTSPFKTAWQRAKEGYKDVTGASDTARKEFAENKPGQALALEMAGTMANPVLRASSGVVKGIQGIVPKILVGGGLGAVEGAAMDALQAEDFSEVPDRLKSGGTIGGVIGSAFPAAGGVVRALKGTSNVPKAAMGSIENVASNDAATGAVKRGMRSNKKLAEETAELAQNALENSENRVKSIFVDGAETSGVNKSINAAKDQYAGWMAKNGTKAVPGSWIKNFFSKNPIAEDAYQQIVRRDPQLAAKLPKNSIGMMQEMRSNLNAKIRNMADDAADKKYYTRAAKELESIIERQFSGYRELQPLYAKARTAENLLETLEKKIGSSGELSNPAASILKNNTKAEIEAVFGKENGDKILNLLRMQRKITDNLRGISKESAKPFMGAFTSTLTAGAIPATFVNPNVLPSLLAAMAAKQGSRALATRGAKEILSGNIAPSISSYLSTLATRGAVSAKE